MSFESRVHSYYAALRDGDPLGEFFADKASIVKFGISDRLTGGDQIREGLRAQTERTEDWVVKSNNLNLYRAGCHACFSDEVQLGWTDTVQQERYQFDTRWSGTLESRMPRDESAESEPVFVAMHVSTSQLFR